MVDPDLLSPDAIAQKTGCAPRHRGSNDGCELNAPKGKASRRWGLNICGYAAEKIRSAWKPWNNSIDCTAFTSSHHRTGILCFSSRLSALCVLASDARPNILAKSGARLNSLAKSRLTLTVQLTVVCSSPLNARLKVLQRFSVAHTTATISNLDSRSNGSMWAYPQGERSPQKNRSFSLFVATQTPATIDLTALTTSRTSRSANFGDSGIETVRSLIQVALGKSSGW